MRSEVEKPLHANAAQPASNEGSNQPRGKMNIKVYLVLAPVEGGGVQVIDAKLKRSAADTIASEHEGAYTQKIVATK